MAGSACGLSGETLAWIKIRGAPYPRKRYGAAEFREGGGGGEKMGEIQKIAINDFVLRQTSESKYSHFVGTWEEVKNLVEANFPSAKKGYRDGVMLVSVPAEGFFSGVVLVNETTPLRATFSARRKGEEHYLQTEALSGQKAPAKAVEVVLYRHDVLMEDNSASSEAEWEIISLNAREMEGPEPLTPMAMARNFLGLAGGTKAEYSAEEFARSIEYWSKRAMRA